MNATAPILVVNDHLTLTPFQPDDKPALVRYLNEVEIGRNTLRVPQPYTAKDADEFMVTVNQRRESLGMAADWAIRDREHGLIGGIGVFAISGVDGHYDELGYWLAEPFRGRGWMTTVVDFFARHQFQTRPNLVRLQAFVFAHNPASVRVLEKAGFQYEGYVRKLYFKKGAYIDAVLLARIIE
jgi:RimJ/RimL family protein N-acetyltransferase